MANKDIRRIQDDWAGVSASLTEGKTALLNDANSENHVFKINGKVFFPAIATSWDGTSYTFLNGKFGGLILGQSQNNTISVDSTNTLIISNDTTGDVHIRAIAGELKLSNYNNDAVILDSSNELHVNGLMLSPTTKVTVGAGGPSGGDRVEIDLRGVSRVQVSPDGTNQYYSLVGAEEGKVVFFRNTTTETPAYVDVFALGGIYAQLMVYDDGDWRTVGYN